MTAASTLAGWRRGEDRAACRSAVLLLAGALSVCAGSGIAAAQSASIARPAISDPFADYIAEASRRFGIPPRWIHAALCAQSARGTAFVRARTLSGGWRHSAPGMCRVVVKTRHVQNAGRNGKSAAHLRYIQRDGTSRDGERDQLYSATEDRADGDAFVERGKEDRHRFRFIVSLEDGADLTDLTAHTRDLMNQIEADLGTKLDWVAVNHCNTGHPHLHVIVRGKDDLGENLVINDDYLANGICSSPVLADTHVSFCELHRSV